MIEEVFLSGWLEHDLVTISWEHQGLSCQLVLCPSFPGQGNFFPFMHSSELCSGPKWTVKCRFPELLSLCSIFISTTFPSKFDPSKLLWTLFPQLSKPPKLCVSSVTWKFSLGNNLDKWRVYQLHVPFLQNQFPVLPVF